MTGPTQVILSKQLELNTSRNLVFQPPKIMVKEPRPLEVSFVHVIPEAPDYARHFLITWEFTVGDGKTILSKTFSGFFRCDICLWFTGPVAEDFPLFDYRQTWDITLASADAALKFIGAPSVRHFMDTRDIRRYVRYTILQVVNASGILAKKLPITVAIKGAAYRNRATDGKLREGDTLNSSAQASISAEYGKIVSRDFDWGGGR